MRTIAFTNQKGGSSKTTSAVSIAAALGELGKRVLLVDLDAQGSASAWLGARGESRGLFELFTDEAKLLDLVEKTDVSGVELVPSSQWLVGLDRALASEPGAETILRTKIRKAGDRWDFVLLDTPPSLGILVLSALVAANEVLVPLEPSPIAMAGLAQLYRTVGQVQERLNPELVVSGVLLCRADSRTNLTKEVEERLRERFPKIVFRATIPDSVRFREAWSYSKPITTYAASSPGAEAYRAVAKELLRRER
jgi:chromosome partitioning protein